MQFNNEDIDEGMKSYFKSLKKFKPLKKEEERRLLNEYKKHKDINARNKLIEANLKYACKLANTYRGRGLSFNELVTEANDGLMEGIERFDMSQDVRLISYSRWWMIQRIQTALQEKNMLQGQDEMVFKDLNDDDDSLMAVRPNAYYVEDAPDETVTEDTEELLNTLLQKLSDREYDMVSYYYGVNGRDKKTLEEIGDKYKLTKERVRQIIEKAILKAKSEAMLVDSVYLCQ